MKEQTRFRKIRPLLAMDWGGEHFFVQDAWNLNHVYEPKSVNSNLFVIVTGLSQGIPTAFSDLLLPE